MSLSLCKFGALNSCISSSQSVELKFKSLEDLKEGNMKKHVISVSRHNLTRCSSCARHHEIDRSLDESELLALRCGFCGQSIIGAANSVPVRASRSSRIALGLLSASLTFTACDDEDEVIEQPIAGAQAGVESPSAGEVAGTGAGVEVIGGTTPPDAPVYGVFPAGQEAGVEMTTAGDDVGQAEYGVFPAGAEAGIEAGAEAGVEMTTAGDDTAQPEYGVFPAGDEAGQAMDMGIPTAGTEG